MSVAAGLARLIGLDETLDVPVVTAGRIGLLLQVAGVRLPAEALSTEAELDAAPRGTLVRAADGAIWQHGHTMWWLVTGPGVGGAGFTLPAVVLWEGES